MKRIFSVQLFGLGLMFATLVLFLFGAGDASDHEWLLGAWSGREAVGNITEPATLKISDDAGQLKWTLSIDGRALKAEAEGAVATSDASSAELVGKYVSHSVADYTGSEVRISLKGSPKALSASGIGERGNRPFTLDLTKS
jgi:hypothetical protein